MAEIIQHEDPEEFPSNMTGNGFHLPPREEEQGTRSRMNQPASRKATNQQKEQQRRQQSQLDKALTGLRPQHSQITGNAASSLSTHWTESYFPVWFHLAIVPRDELTAAPSESAKSPNAVGSWPCRTPRAPKSADLRSTATAQSLPAGAWTSPCAYSPIQYI